MDGDDCPAIDFLTDGEESTAASRQGLLSMLVALSQNGFEEVPEKWHHEASKQKKIHEFIKGKLRLFYFKGEGNQIAVCTGGVLKKEQKADGAAVERAARMRKQYFDDLESNALELEVDEDEDQ